MQVFNLSFKNDKRKYSLYITEVQLKSILADDVFTSTYVDAKSGKIVNHGEEIEYALGIEKTKKGEDNG